MERAATRPLSYRLSTAVRRPARDLGELRPPADHNSPRSRGRFEEPPGKSLERHETPGRRRCRPALREINPLCGTRSRMLASPSTRWNRASRPRADRARDRATQPPHARLDRRRSAGAGVPDTAFTLGIADDEREARTRINGSKRIQAHASTLAWLRRCCLKGAPRGGITDRRTRVRRCSGRIGAAFGSDPLLGACRPALPPTRGALLPEEEVGDRSSAGGATRRKFLASVHD
jgi:hypothetical protein